MSERDETIHKLREALVWIELSAMKRDHPAPALLLDSIKRCATAALALGDGFIGDPHPVMDPVFRSAELVAPPPGETMREKIARAAGDEFEKQGNPWPGHVLLLDVADAVLEAMREPTEAMTRRGSYNVNSVGLAGSPLHADACWRAMIDAARKP